MKIDKRLEGVQHNRRTAIYMYWVGVGEAMIASGRINVRDGAGKIWSCYNCGIGRTDEIHYSLVGQSALMAMDGRAKWSDVVGTQEWSAARAGN